MAATLTTIWAALVVLLGLAETRHVWNRYRVNPPAPRGLLAMLPLAAAMMLLILWLRLVRTPYDNWNAARTAPAVAWAMGYPLYYDRGAGPAMDFIYGPVAAIVRLPAALAHTPTGAILTAASINTLIWFLPAILFIRSQGRPRLATALAIILFLGFSLTTPSLTYSISYVHADAPAVGFALLACTALINAAESARRNRMLLLAAICAVLSVGSKQNMAPLLIALPCYAALRFSFHETLVLIAFEAVLLAIAVAIAIGSFGSHPLIYTTFISAVRPPRSPGYGWSTNLLLAFGALLRDVALPGILISLIGLFEIQYRKRFGNQSLKLLIQRDWFLPLLVGLFMLPMGLLGYARAGGEINSFTLIGYFFAAAICGWTAQLESDGAPSSEALVGGVALLAIWLGVLSLTPFSNFLEYWREATHLQDNPQQLAYEFSLKHPQQAYFPWNPLSTLLADRKYYLFDYGAIGLRLGGEPMSRERIKEYLPSQMEYLIYPPSAESQGIRTLFPEFSQPAAVAGLDGWTVFTQPK